MWKTDISHKIILLTPLLQGKHTTISFINLCTQIEDTDRIDRNDRKIANSYLCVVMHIQNIFYNFRQIHVQLLGTQKD